MPPVSVLFASLLGYNPIKMLLGPALAHLPAAQAAYPTGRGFFPSLVSPAFSHGLNTAFNFAIAACLVAGIASLFRGQRYVHDDHATALDLSERGNDGHVLQGHRDQGQRGPVRHPYSPSALLAAMSCRVISSEEEDVLSQAATEVRPARSSRDLTPAVRLVAVRKTYGPVLAVASVDLEIGGGEFFTLLGPSGSGKTTLLRLIAGFERPDSGAVELGGVNVTRQPPYA